MAKRDKPAGRLGSILVAAGALLIAAALTALIVTERDEWAADGAAQKARQALERRTEGAETAFLREAPGMAEIPEGEITEADEAWLAELKERTPAPEGARPEPSPTEPAALSDEMDAVEIDGDAYIGELSIPALGLTLPVMSQWSYAKLKRAPCRYEGSVQNRSMILLAHNYRRHFGQIHALTPGDAVWFTDVHGSATRYEVTLVETLGPKETARMREGDWDLTLFTCTYGGSSRVTVRCAEASASAQGPSR